MHRCILLCTGVLHSVPCDFWGLWRRAGSRAPAGPAPPGSLRAPRQNEKWHLKFLEKPDLAVCVVLPGGATSGKVWEGTCDDDKCIQGDFFFPPHHFIGNTCWK